MRVKRTAYKAFVELIQAKGLDPSTFEFSKKRGLLYIHDPHGKEAFTFFRKKTTFLNAQKQWEDQEVYYFGLPSKKANPISWEAVKQAFVDWLAEIPGSQS